MKPLLPKFAQVEKYLRQMDENRFYSNSGPLHDALLQKYASMCGVRAEQVVLCANATLAIQGSAHLMPVEEFFTPAFTFPASISAVLNAGKSVLIRDIESHDWRIDLSGLEPTAKQCVVDVLPFGAPIDLKKNETWEYVIVDAAASLGSRHIDLVDLPENWVVVFSLHATKVLGIGEGGLAIFGSIAAADQFRAWINFGFRGSRESSLPGINAKMSEMSAAYGLAVLEQKEIEITEWQIANTAAATINHELGMGNITDSFNGVSPYWMVQLRDAAKIERLEKRFLEIGIGTRRWWALGCHRMPAFKTYADGQNFPISDLIARTTLGLPMFRDMDSSHFKFIAEELQKI